MFGKGKKKLDRKMRRRIRKTSAVMLLISAIVVAAIPVPEAAAAGNTAEPNNHAHSVTTNEGTVSGSVSGLIPRLTENDKIYCTSDGKFQFAYKDVTGYGNQGILVGYVASPGDGKLVIDDVLEAYVPYTNSEGTGRGYAASNQDGTPLYYKRIREATMTRSVAWDEAEGKFSYGIWSAPDYKEEVTETSKNSIGFSAQISVPSRTSNVQTLSFYTYKFYPCKKELSDEWEIKDNNGNIIVNYYLYYTVASDKIPAGSENRYTEGKDSDYWDYCQLPTDSSLNDAGFSNGRTELRNNIGMSTSAIDSDILTNRDTSKKGYYFDFAGVNEKWLGNIKVGCISNQRVSQKNGVYQIDDAVEGRKFFTGGGTITSVDLPNSLFAIADESFKNCTSLETVTFGGGNSNETSLLRVLGASAFEGCTSLTSFRLPDASDVEIIGQGAFRACSSLKSFFLPTNIVKIGDEAFKGCKKLEGLAYKISEDGDIVSNLTDIGNNVFEDCNELKSITFPDTLTDTGDALFKSCSALENVTLPKNDSFNVMYFSDFEGCITLKWICAQSDKTTFDVTKGYPFDVDDFRLQAGESFYFKGSGNRDLNDDLISKIYNDVTSKYGMTYFNMDEGYYEITSTDPETGAKLTYFVDEKGQLLNIKFDADKPSDVRIPSKVGEHSINTIGDKFQGNKNIKTLYIPNTVHSIAENAFKGCYNLEKVTFQEPNTIGRDDSGNIIPDPIGKDAFYTQHDSPYNEPKKLLFVGNIDDDSEPFKYAMNNTYHNRMDELGDKGYEQPVSYIEFSSGNPTNIHVVFDGGRDGTNKRIVTHVPKADNVMTKNKDLYGGSLEGGEEDEYYLALEEALAGTGKYNMQNEITGEDVRDANGEIVIDKDKLKDEIVRLVEVYEDTHKIDTEVASVIAAFESAIKITLPTGIQGIKPGLFSEADKDNTAYNGKGVTENAENISESSPKRNHYVEEITMYDIEELDDYAFYGCDKLETVVMYSSAAGNEQIGSYAFGQCKELKNVTIPTTTRVMGSKTGEEGTGVRPFAGDDNLAHVYFTGRGVQGGTVSGSEKGNYFECKDGIIYELNGGKPKIVQCLPGRGNVIGGNVLDSGELESVSEIYPEAFMGCKNIVMVDLSNADDLKEIPNYCFANDNNLALLYLPLSCQTIGDYAAMDAGIVLLKLPNKTMELSNAPEAFYSSNKTDNILHDVYVLTPEGSSADLMINRKPSSLYSRNGWKTNELPKRKIRFEDADGTFIAEIKADLGDTIKSPDINDEYKDAWAKVLAKHEGQYFDRWDTPFTPVLENITVKAVFTDTPPTMWKVNFVNDDWKDVIPEPFSVRDGEAVVEPKTPVSSKGDQYKFVKWIPNVASMTLDKITGDVTFMASYEFVGNVDAPGGSVPGGSNGSGNSGTSGNGSGSNGTTDGNNTNKTLYTLTVVNGSGSGSYAADTMVTVAAYTPNTGYEFYNWTSSESDTEFTSKTMAATAFKMPAKNLTVTANYKTKSETGNSITSRRTPGTVTSAPSSNTGSVNGGNNSNGGSSGNNSNNGNSGSSVQVSRPGISNSDVASATVNGSTDNFVVKVTEDGQATMAVAEALRNEYGSLDNIHYFAMDISLYDENGTQKVTDTSGLSVTITLPIPDELRQYAGNNKVGAVTGGNNLDKLNARFTTVNGVPCVTFTATHFSPYTIYVDTANLLAGGYDATPKTGDGIHPKWFLAIGLALFSAVLFLKKDKKVSPSAA